MWRKKYLRIEGIFVEYKTCQLEDSATLADDLPRPRKYQPDPLSSIVHDGKVKRLQCCKEDSSKRTQISSRDCSRGQSKLTNMGNERFPWTIHYSSASRRPVFH